MILENRYGLSPDQLNKMVKDGVIPCSVVNHYSIYEHFQRLRNECPSCPILTLAKQIEDRTGEPFENVRKIIYKLGKIS